MSGPLEQTFDGIGGVQALTAWANENPTDFYRLWARLLATEIGDPVEVAVGNVTPSVQAVLGRMSGHE